MLKLFKYISAFIIFLIVAIVVILSANYFNTAINIEKSRRDNDQTIAPVITVMDWNLGYAGLGKDSDFVMDGGENLLPPNKETVETNIAGIINILKSNPAEFYFIQEISKPDMLNYGVDVLGKVRAALSTYSSYFTFDFHTVFYPQE